MGVWERRSQIYQVPISKTSKMSCAICMDQFKQPKVLRCGHTFCLACIEHWYESKHRHSSRKDGSGRRVVRCPACLRYTPVPPASADNDGFPSLPTNFALLEALEASSIRLFEDDEDDRPSTSWMCRTHLGKLLEFQCETCDGQLVCRQCVDSQHRPDAGHRIGSLVSLVRRQNAERAELEQMVMELQVRNMELTECNAILQLDTLDRHENSSARKNVVPIAQKSTPDSVTAQEAETNKTKSKSRSEEPQERINVVDKRKPPPIPPGSKTKSLPTKYGLPAPPAPPCFGNGRQRRTRPPPQALTSSTIHKPRSDVAQE
ncbi:tripartite motif-containing protein 2-like [Acanthaster planci]|uniref:Tripartite motif-containing protein 2-like n=1 Tax=Acanthaster planci TaxID=133434 RepID=A0A8B7Z708_ACAPL|nr:tripartite motif-containing protein 2-like [Acanthaster planci]